MSDEKELSTERVIIPMTKGLVTEIDDYRFGNRIDSRAEAVRALIKYALKAISDEKERPKN